MRFRKLLVPLRNLPNLVLVEHWFSSYISLHWSSICPKSQILQPNSPNFDRGSNNTYPLHTRKPKTLFYTLHSKLFAPLSRVEATETAVGTWRSTGLALRV